MLAKFRRDPEFGEYEVLVDIPVDDCPPSEGDWHNALKWESTRNYVTWLLRGSEPPPIAVVEHIDGDLVSINRRRWLAAREVGHRLIKAWSTEGVQDPLQV